ncbi:MAG TPA: hypothetical protein PL044_00905 [Clostridiales bacterium]|nr:hypothetical protein [Clostridiales bacterium]HQK72327.1 hypothetical protein [Clostridiales bacterium]
MKKFLIKSAAVIVSLAMLFGVTAAGAGTAPAGKPAAEASAQLPQAASQAVAGKISTAASVEEAVGILTKGRAPAAKAAEKTDGGVLTQCGGNCGHSPSILIPGIGQSDVYLLDENGNRALDEDGNEISAWPVLIDTDYLIKKLALPLAKMLITQRDNGFTDFAAKTVKEALAQSAIGLDGHPVSNIEVEKYPYSVAACNEQERGKIYNTIPLQDYSKVAGEDHLYFFAYNSFGNNIEIAEELYQMIQQVKRETGHDKVNIIPISLGSTVAVTLFELHPEVKEDLDEVVFIVPALDGSRLVGDLYQGKFSTDNESLYKTLMPSLVEGYTGYLINVALRLIPKQIIFDLLDKVVDAIRDVMLTNCTMLWGLVPGGDYDALAAKYLADDAHAEIRRQTDIFHRAQLNVRENILAFKESGVDFYDIVDYNFPLYSFVPSSKTCNGDGLIHFESESIGATSGYINTPLPDGYVQQNTHCTDPSHNHISPERIVDASTGLLPETTFYFLNQDHEGTGRNDVVMKLATEILLYDELKDVHSMPERFPQFNVGRETKWLRKDTLPMAKAVDQSTLAPEDAAELQAAIEQCEAMLDTTVVVYDEFTAAQQRLDNILIKIGVLQPPEDDTAGKIATALCKLVSDALYRYWGPRGFSDGVDAIG